MTQLAKHNVRAVFSGHLHFNVGKAGTAAAFARAAAEAAGLSCWTRRLQSLSNTLWRMFWAGIVSSLRARLNEKKTKRRGDSHTTRHTNVQAAATLSQSRLRAQREAQTPPQGISGTISAEECAHISTASVNPGHPSSIFAPLPLLPAMVAAIGDDAFVGETQMGLRVVRVFEDRLEHEFVSLE